MSVAFLLKNKYHSGLDPITLKIKDGRVSGSAGCNSYFAQYNSTGTSLSISGIGSTKMYCGAPGVMQQESTYLSLLGQVTSFTIEGNRLRVSDAKGITLLSFARHVQVS